MSKHDKQGSNRSDTPEVFQVARGRGRRQFLQAVSAGAAAGAVAGSACKSSAGPTPVPTTATTSVPATTTTRVTTTTTTTTTTVAGNLTLTVIVTGNDGRGIGDAEVVVTSGPQAGLVKRTDNNGRCELNGLSAGRITVRVTKGSTVRTFEVNLTGSQSLEATLPTAGTPTTVGGGSGTTTSSSTVTLHYWYPN